MNFLYIHQQRQFDPHTPLPHIQKTIKPLSTDQTPIKIGIIGDSWAIDTTIEKTITQCLLQSNLDCTIASIAHPGVNSRQIYRNIFLDCNQPYSSRSIFMPEHPIDQPNYLIIILGVNDTGGHIGKDFYAHHMIGIIKAAYDRSMTPIVLESPEFDIKNTPGRGLASRGKRLLFRWLFDHGKINVIEDYRHALRQAIERLPPEQQPILLSFQTTIGNSDQDKCYYSDSSHLNQNGNEKLGRAIAQTVLHSIPSQIEQRA
jgi:hypothetical protein